MQNRPFVLSTNEYGAIIRSNDTYNLHAALTYVPPELCGATIEPVSLIYYTTKEVPKWQGTDKPPEDYGSDILTLHKKEVYAYTFYCDSVSWDDSLLWEDEYLTNPTDEQIAVLDSRDMSGDGTKENPWKNVTYALEKLTCYFNVICPSCFYIQLKVSGTVDYTVCTYTDYKRNSQSRFKGVLILNGCSVTKESNAPYLYGYYACEGVQYINCSATLTATDESSAYDTVMGFYSRYSTFTSCTVTLSGAIPSYAYGLYADNSLCMGCKAYVLPMCVGIRSQAIYDCDVISSSATQPEYSATALVGSYVYLCRCSSNYSAYIGIEADRAYGCSVHVANQVSQAAERPRDFLGMTVDVAAYACNVIVDTISEIYGDAYGVTQFTGINTNHRAELINCYVSIGVDATREAKVEIIGIYNAGSNTSIYGCNVNIVHRQPVIHDFSIYGFSGSDDYAAYLYHCNAVLTVHCTTAELDEGGYRQTVELMGYSGFANSSFYRCIADLNYTGTQDNIIVVGCGFHDLSGERIFTECESNHISIGGDFSSRCIEI